MNIASSFRFSTLGMLLGFAVYSAPAKASGGDTIPVYFDGYTTNSRELAADLLNNRSLLREGFEVKSRTCSALPCGNSRNQVWISVSYADHLYTANVHNLHHGRLMGEQTVSSSSLPGLKVKLSQLVPDIYRSDVENPQSNAMMVTGSANTIQQSKSKSAVLIVSKRRTVLGNKQVSTDKKSKEASNGLGRLQNRKPKADKKAKTKGKEAKNKSAKTDRKTKAPKQINRKLRLLTEAGYENGWYNTQYYARVVQAADGSDLDLYAWQTLGNQNALSLSAGLGYSFGKWDIGATGGILRTDTTIDANTLTFGQDFEESDVTTQSMNVQRAKAHLTRSVFSVGGASVSIGGEAAFTVFETFDIDDSTYPRFAQQGVLSAGGLAKIDTNKFYVSIPVGVAFDTINAPGEDYDDGGILSTSVDESDPTHVERRPSIDPLYMGLRIGMKF